MQRRGRPAESNDENNAERTRRADRRLAARLEGNTSVPLPPDSAPPAPPAPGVRRVAGDAMLTNDQVEKVLGRAAEIDSGLDTDVSVDITALIKAAKEVGLSEDSMRQAVAEVRSGEQKPDGFFGRLLVGDEIVETDLADLGAAQASEIIDGWMRNAEGLRPARVDQQSVRWEPDRRWATRLRMGIGRETAGMRLDGQTRLAHSVTEVGPDKSLVAVRANTEPVRQLGTAGIGVAGVAAAAAVVPALAVTEGAVETILAVGTIGVGGGGIVAGIVFITKFHVRQLREAMRRPLDAVSRAEPPSDPAQIVDVVVDQLRRFRRRRSES